MGGTGAVAVTRTAADRILDEGALPLARAATAEGVEARHPSTLFRWAVAGIAMDELLEDGQRRRVYLETCRIGGRLRTSRAAMRRFLAAIQRPRVKDRPATVAVDSDAVLQSFGLGRVARR